MNMTNDIQLKKAEESAKDAFYAALAQASLTVGAIILVVSGIIRSTNVSLLNLTDVALIVGLGYGTKRKSRTCATILFFYQVLNIVFMGIAGTGLAMGILAVLFTLYYFKGMTGSFAYHRRRKEMKTSTQQGPSPYAKPEAANRNMTESGTGFASGEG